MFAHYAADSVCVQAESFCQIYPYTENYKYKPLWLVLVSMAEELHFLHINFILPEISLVRSESRSLVLPLSSDTSHEGLHSLQHSVDSRQSACGPDFSPILLH